MRSLSLIRLSLLIGFSLSFQECSDTCSITNTYTYFKPVYSSMEEVRKAVGYEHSRALKNPGKIYFKDNLLFVNETGEGIHIINNANPTAPTDIGFLKIPGNYDLVIYGDYLYADSYVDMIVFSIADNTEVKQLTRIKNIFNNTLSYGYHISNSNSILTGWEKISDVSIRESDCSSQVMPWGGRAYEDGILMSASSSMTGSVSPSNHSTSTGVGGSTARFTISHANLYALDGNRLDIIDITHPDDPKFCKEVVISSDTETLFPYKDKLFIGSKSGMYIYDLKTPQAPVLISKYEHVRSCDPVIVDDTYAYVTLRNGNSCTGYTNQLEVINISNPLIPVIVKTYPMTNPYGLGIDANVLFVCDGSAGLKVYDAKDINALDANQLAHYPGIQAIDIIPYHQTAMMIAKEGLYQYDYSDLKNIVQVSKLPIQQ